MSELLKGIEDAAKRSNQNNEESGEDSLEKKVKDLENSDLKAKDNRENEDYDMNSEYEETSQTDNTTQAESDA